MTPQEQQEENLMCRKLVRNILRCDLSQRQLFFVIYLLTMHLEDLEKSQKLASLCRELGFGEMFLTDAVTDEE